MRVNQGRSVREPGQREGKKETACEREGLSCHLWDELSSFC
jgi:hypothetical protein